MPPFILSNAPRLFNFLSARADVAAGESITVSELFRDSNPSGILSALMLLSPDIIQKAIAQNAGRVITPVAFSFGWVAYAATSLLRVVGGMLPGQPAKLITEVG